MKKLTYLVPALLSVGFLAATAQAQVTEENYNFTGGSQSWVVPDGVTSVNIKAYGAEGHNASVPGGEGGYATGDLSVSPGETLTIMVGGHGLPAVGADVPMGGGFNGGGNGMNNFSGGTVVGGGGGASDVRQGGTALANRVVVAAGGGGATSNDTVGGHGGGLVGDNGGQCCDGTTATGGSQVAGGSAGGTLGQGGSGIPQVHTPWIGGGGGGYYGGGTSDAHSGGAGGSSYIGGVTAGSTTTGGRQGDGLVVIAYEVGATSTSTSVPTLSQWGLITLMLLMFGGAVVILRRKQAN